MSKNELFVAGEEEWETPKQSPQSNQTWPMDKIRQRRFHHKMSSLLSSPVTPKRNYTVNQAKSLLLQCLRDSKSDPIPRSRQRFPGASYSDDGILMDGVLVTSATGKKVSNSPSSSLGRSALSSSVVRSQQKNAEFSTPRCKSGTSQETTQSQHLSVGKRRMLEDSPSTKVDTPKAASASKLQASAEPFIFTPRSSQRLASHRLPHDLDLHFQCGSPLSNQQLPSSYSHQYLPLSYAYPRQPPLYTHLPASPHGPDFYHTHCLSQSPRPTCYQMPRGFNQSPSSTNPTSNLRTNTTIHGSVVDGLNTVTQKANLSLPYDELEARTQKPDLSPLPSSAWIQTTKKDWSPCDDGLETFAQAQYDFENSLGRILPDDVFEHYRYRKRLSVFNELCLDHKLSQLQPQELAW